MEVINIERANINIGLTTHSGANILTHAHNALNRRNETNLFRNQEIVKEVNASNVLVDADFIKVFTAVKMSCAVSTLRKDVRKRIGKDFTGVGSTFAI